MVPAMLLSLLAFVALPYPGSTDLTTEDWPVKYHVHQYNRTGTESPGRWHTVNHALYKFCNPRNDCWDWRYMGNGIFFYYGNRLSAPGWFELRIGKATKPNYIVACSKETEPPRCNIQMNLARLRYMQNVCQPAHSKRNCLWDYIGCGQFRYFGHRSDIVRLPFAITPLRRPIEQGPNFGILDGLTIAQSRVTIPEPMPPMEPLTCEDITKPSSFAFAMAMMEHIYVIQNGTGVNGIAPIFVIDKSAASTGSSAVRNEHAVQVSTCKELFDH